MVEIMTIWVRLRGLEWKMEKAVVYDRYPRIGQRYVYLGSISKKWKLSGSSLRASQSMIYPRKEILMILK